MSRHRQRIDNVGAQIGRQFRIRGKLLLQPRSARVDRILPHLRSTRPRLHQASHHVCSHERMAVIGFPPSPAAILMLKTIQAIEPGMNLLLERRFIQIGVQIQAMQRILHHNIRQKARHRLFHTAVRK